MPGNGSLEPRSAIQRTCFRAVQVLDVPNRVGNSKVVSIAAGIDSDEADCARIYIGSSTGEVNLFTVPLSRTLKAQVSGSPLQTPPEQSPPGSLCSTPRSSTGKESVASLYSSSVPVAGATLGGSAVRSLCSLPNAKCVAALVENEVTLLDWTTLDRCGTVASVKGAFLLTPNQQLSKDEHKLSRGSQLAIVARRKVVLFHIEQLQTGPAASLIREIPLLEPALTVAWLESVLFVGRQQDYVLISTRDGSSTQLFSLPKGAPGLPLLQPLPLERGVVLLADNVGLVVDAEGQPAGSPLVFSSPPEALCQSPGYVLAGAHGRVDVYSRKTGVVVQELVLDQRSNGLLATSVGPCQLTTDAEGKCVAAAFGSSIFALLSVPIEEQAKELLRRQQYDQAATLIHDAIDLHNLTTEEQTCLLCNVHGEAGFLLLYDLYFNAAVEHFNSCPAFDPSELFPFFPTYTARWRVHIPRKRYWGLHPPPRPLSDVIQNGLFARQSGFLPPSNSQPERGTLPELLNTAKRVIVDFLISFDKDIRKEVASGVDTLIVKLLIDVGQQAELEAVAKGVAKAVPQEIEAPLRIKGWLHELALLLEGAGQPEQALLIWQDIVTSASARAGVAARETARTLRGLADSALVLQHVKWLLHENLKLALEVLTWQGTKLQTGKVLALLKKESPETWRLYLQWLVEEQGSEDRDLHTQLAEALAAAALTALSVDETAELELEEPTLSIVTEPSPAPPQEPQQGPLEDYFTLDNINTHRIGETYSDGASTSQGLAELLKSKQKLTDKDRARLLKSPIAGALAKGGSILWLLPRLGGAREAVALREQLLEFLQESQRYAVEEVLEAVRGTPLWHEQVILHHKAGDRLSALRVLALELHDTDAAEAYCMHHGGPDSYLHLLEMYLRPGPGVPPMHAAAVELLHCHSAALDPLKVLEALSDDMPLALAAETVARIMRERVHRHRQGQIVRHLARAENFAGRLVRLEERMRSVEMTSERACWSCHARLGTKLFAVYPNDVLVCYKCLKQSGEHICRVTGRDFRKTVDK